MTIEGTAQAIIDSLAGIYERPEAENIAGILIEYVTGLNRTKQLVQKKDTISAGQSIVFQDALQRLKDHEPVQYIVKEAWFHDLKFYVDERVLIPRPETDELVEWICREIKSLPAGQAGQKSKIKSNSLLDIGTGSGCIAISIKKSLPGFSITAIDESEGALEVAKINATGLGAAVNFIHTDFLNPVNWQKLPVFDIMVSNPPYIPQKDKAGMYKNVLEYEPHEALFVPDDNPLLFYEAIASFAKDHLSKDGKIFLEIHEELGEAVTRLFRENQYASVTMMKDMQGKDRMVKVMK